MGKKKTKNGERRGKEKRDGLKDRRTAGRKDGGKREGKRGNPEARRASNQLLRSSRPSVLQSLLNKEIL